LEADVLCSEAGDTLTMLTSKKYDTIDTPHIKVRLYYRDRTPPLPWQEDEYLRHMEFTVDTPPKSFSEALTLMHSVLPAHATFADVLDGKFIRYYDLLVEALPGRQPYTRKKTGGTPLPSQKKMEALDVSVEDPTVFYGSITFAYIDRKKEYPFKGEAKWWRVHKIPVR
jgi:hypothetical protein